MLTLLKAWRNLQHLKGKMDNWKFAFDMFLETASQHDRDVIAGSWYYYESKSVVVNKSNKGEENIMDEGNEDDIEDEDCFENHLYMHV